MLHAWKYTQHHYAFIVLPSFHCCHGSSLERLSRRKIRLQKVRCLSWWQPACQQQPPHPQQLFCTQNEILQVNTEWRTWKRKPGRPLSHLLHPTISAVLLNKMKEKSIASTADSPSFRCGSFRAEERAEQRGVDVVNHGCSLSCVLHREQQVG